jgi:hypothetical protein
MKKIIFLDIDGVLNSSDYLATRSKDESEDLYKYLDNFIDERAVLVLEEIASKSNAEIVISSTWRLYHFETLKTLLPNKGLTSKIIGKTPNKKGCCRGCQIHQWIRDNISYLEVDSASSFKSYLILDDDTDMLLQQKDNFIHITNDYGLTEKYIQICLNVLC